MRQKILSILAALLILAGICGNNAVAGSGPLPNQWNGTGPFATNLGNRVITALAVSPDGKTAYAGTGSGTVFSYAYTPPVVTTGAVTDILGTAATLNGTVKANNADSTVSFEYGTDTNYGSSGPATPATVTGMAETTVALDISSLTIGTTYHFRVVATNSAGTSYGDDQILDITPPDTAITSYPANPTRLTAATFTFSGSDGTGLGVSGFECALDGSFASCTSPKEYTGLGDGNHTFQVRALDLQGNVDSTPASFSWVVDTTNPVINLSALPNGATTRSTVINLAGTVTDSLSGPDEFTIGGVPVTIASDGSFSYPVELAIGSNALTLTATDESDNTRTVTLTINRQGGNPLLTVTSPDNVSSNQTAGQIQGTVDPAVTGVTVKVNTGNPMAASIDNIAHTFSITLDGSDMNPGLNTLLITATDGTNTDTVKRTVFLNTVATLAITTPAEDLIFSQKGTLPLTFSLAMATTPLDINISKDGGVTFTKLTAVPVTSGDFTDSVALPALQHYPVVITATDPNDEDKVVARVIRTVITKYRPCDAGTSSVDGEAPCTACAAGTYQTLPEQTSCIAAPAGSYVFEIGAIAASLCPVGFYQDQEGQTSCKPAPAGSFVTGTGQTSAQLCAIGTYQPATGQSACTAAPAGSFVAGTGQAGAQLCTPGTYQPATGQTACLNSSAGSFVSDSGATTATLCSIGFYQDLTAQTSCKSAPAGGYVNAAGQTNYLTCAAGSYQNLTGQASCTLAPVGSFVADAGQATYQACAAGSYQDLTGQTSCKTTPAGSFSGSGQSSPTPCDPGTYQPATGQAACLEAPAGNFVVASGQTVFEACTIGSYQPLTGQSSCLTCPAGTTTNNPGQLACIASVTLTVAGSGTGSGTISDPSSGISCGSSCAATFGAGLQKTLTITAGSASALVNAIGCNGILAGNSYTTGAIYDSCTVTATFRDTTLPVLVVSTLSGGTTPDQVLNITGNTTDSAGIQRLTVNDQPVLVQPDGSFNTAVELVPGLNTLTVVTTDNAGNQATATRNITYSDTALAITVTAPADGSRLPDSFIEVSGTIGAGVTAVNVNVIDPDTGSTTNSTAAAISGATFTATVNLASGMNTIEIVASGTGGTSSRLSRTVFSDASAPYLAIDAPGADLFTTTYNLNLTGVVDRSTSPLNLRISTDNGISFTPITATTDGTSRGTFTKTVNLTVDQINPIIVQALDSSNNPVTSVQRNSIYRAPLSLTFDPLQPKAVGTRILVTAKVYDNPTGYSFRFLLKAPLASSAIEVQPYSANATWNWDTSSLTPGEYTITVQAKRTGSAAAYDLTRSVPYIISPADGATAVIFKTAPPWGTTFQIGNEVSVTAEASGGSAPYEYQFKVLFNNTFVSTGSFSTSPDFTWTTTGLAPGRYAIYVYARRLGSPVAFETYKSIAYGLMSTPPMSGVAFTTAPASGSSFEAGTSVPFVAQGSGGSGSYEYQFKIYKDTTLVQITPYQTANSFTWLTAGMSPGEYRIYVYARQTGSVIAYEAYKVIGCYIAGIDRFRIAGPPLLYFSTLQSAYTVAASNGTIQALNLPIAGPAIALTTTRAVTVTVDGGWNGSFSGRSGFTTINGKIELRAGKLIVRNLKVR